MNRLVQSGLNGYDVTTMREMGVRELKAKLSEVLRSVQAGEPVRITNNGKPVADLVPPGEQTFEERMDALAALGLVRRATPGPLPPPPPLVTLPEGVEGGSAMILAERASYYDDEP